MNLRVVPWLTPALTDFLNNTFKWYSKLVGHQTTVLEWGGGNSSLYFLQKKCKVMTVESDTAFLESVSSMAKNLGHTVCVVQNVEDALKKYNDHDLTILNVPDLQSIGTNIFDALPWDIVVNDGISRDEVLDAVGAMKGSPIVILDNAEYCANWGHLERSSGKKKRATTYRNFIRNPDWQKYLFEQPEGRDGYCAADSFGWESPNRWISSVFWKNDHLFQKLMVTHLGFPLVNLDGLADEDLKDLEERCPFDWDKMEWVVGPFPEALDLKLDRDYD